MLALACASAMAGVGTQTSVSDGVTVAVTAGNLSPQAPVWDFAVVLHSSGAPLPDDIADNAVLVEPRGHAHKALAWEGAPPSGDHRGGVLKFVAPEPRPDSVELRIVRSGEGRPRVFSWWLTSGLVAER